MKYVFQHLLGEELRNIKLNQILKDGVNEYVCLSVRVNNNVLNKYFKIIGFNRRGLIILNDENKKFQKKDIMRIDCKVSQTEKVECYILKIICAFFALRGQILLVEVLTLEAFCSASLSV